VVKNTSADRPDETPTQSDTADDEAYKTGPLVGIVAGCFVVATPVLRIVMLNLGVCEHRAVNTSF
jgi:hypothetical protein